MNISWGSEGAWKFVTNVGLITSDGPHGPNVMAAEWTHHISYSPGLIAVCFGPNRTTLENIRKTKEFGVSIASADQNILSNVAGGNSGLEVNKIGVLKELGNKFYPGEKIKTLMIEDAALNAECKVIKEIELGDHTMVVGEVVDLKITDKEPIAYHKGQYWTMNKNVEKPSDKEIERIKSIVEKYKKN